MAEKLGDVVGAMLADVARARVRADVEALRIAEAYSRDPLLRHLSVPRFRLPDLVVDLPVLVTGVDAPAGSGDPWKVKPPTKAELAGAVRDGVRKSELKLSKTQMTAIMETVSARADQVYGKDDAAALSPGTVADELAATTVDAVKARLKKDPPPEQLTVLSKVTRA